MWGILSLFFRVILTFLMNHDECFHLFFFIVLMFLMTNLQKNNICLYSLITFYDYFDCSLATKESYHWNILIIIMRIIYIFQGAIYLETILVLFSLPICFLTFWFSNLYLIISYNFDNFALRWFKISFLVIIYSPTFCFCKPLLFTTFF